MSSRTFSDPIYSRWPFLCDLSAQPNICTVLLVSQTSERHSHSLENEMQLIVTTLCVTNEQNGEKGKLDQTIQRLPHAQKVTGHISSFCFNWKI